MVFFAIYTVGLFLAGVAVGAHNSGKVTKALEAVKADVAEVKAAVKK